MSLNILTCIKQVPSGTSIEIDETTGVLKRDTSKAKLNPYDLYALELAYSLREKHGGRVDTLSMGPPAAKGALFEALCMGSDAAFLLSDSRFAGSDVLATARALAGAIRVMGGYSLIICGKQTTDGDTAQVGPALAEFLDIEHVSYAHSVTIDERTAQGGVRVVSGFGNGELEQILPLPCLITVEKDINTPRLPSYKRSLTAREEDIKVLCLDDLIDADERRYGLSGSPTLVERIYSPDSSVTHEIWRGDADFLSQRAAEILRSEKFV